ncbi:MAG: S-layer homology domain-containing protein [Clostridia bacterium]|nr:S-layer homology domain-containing protein [Clostridia bacterium]
MRKIIAMFLIVFIVSFGTAYADNISVTVDDMVNDTLLIKGDALAGDEITIFVFNPGYTLEDYLSISVDGDTIDASIRDEAIQFVDRVYADSDGYKKTFQVKGASGGKYTVLAVGDGIYDEGYITFYGSDYKRQIIQDINSSSEDVISEKCDEFYTAFGISDTPLYDSCDKEALGKALAILRDTLEQQEIPRDISLANTYLNEALVVASYNTDSALLMEDGKVKKEYLSKISEDVYEDYCVNLSPEGVEVVNENVFEKTYKTEDEIAESLTSSVMVNVLMNYKDRGYGHVHTMLNKYREYYEDAGIKIPKAENRDLYNKLINSGAQSLDEIKDIMNSNGKTDKNEIKPISPSPSGGGGGVGGSSSKPESPETPTTPESTQTPSVPQDNKTLVSSFKDISSSHWGYEHICKLSEKNIIKGYEDGTFRPDSNITRAEFVKIVVDAFSIPKAQKNSEFKDVTENDWFASYIKSAYDRGIVGGFDGLFYPNEKITREDVAIIIYRALALSENQSETEFSDNDKISQYAKNAVSYLSQNGIITGYETNEFKPEKSITRAEVATVISRLFEKEVLK